MAEITIPNNWQPRNYQKPLWNYLCRGGKRAMAIWHRRAGKDEVALNFAAVAAHEPGRACNLWHCMPEYAQCRKALWTAVNSHTGKRRIDEAFPPEVRESTNEQEMFIRFKSGSTWQLIGSDNYNAQMGASPAGIIYSEWALAHPAAWGYHRPILEENNGFALFITTPRMRNHAKTMYDMASKTPGWFAEILTAIDTRALRAEQLEAALTEYVALFGRDVGAAQYQQEYLCDFNAAILGSFFALEMMDVHKEKRISELCVADPDRVVHRAWDIGVRDDTAIWWFQVVGSQLFILDVYGSNNVGVDHYAQVIRERAERHGWKHGTDYVPHDAMVREWGSTGARTRVESMQREGLNPLLAPDATKLDGIEALRRSLPMAVFHPRCEEVGIAALEQYRREWDDELKAFGKDALHDWTSHYADAARCMALAWKALPVVKVPEPKREGWFIPPPGEKPYRPYRGMRL